MDNKMIDCAVTSLVNEVFPENRLAIVNNILITWLNMALNDDKEYVVKRINDLNREINDKNDIIKKINDLLRNYNL